VLAPAAAAAPKRARKAAHAARHELASAPDGARVQSASEMLTEARQLLRNERYEDAAARYQALREAYPESPEAHTVILSLAELQIDRLGQPQQALNGLEGYLRSGRGTLTEEARQIRIRALRALGKRDLEGDAIAEFLREHPRSFKAAALVQRLRELRQGP
jgi:thioredoxin-like negative regulator of GroEL